MLIGLAALIAVAIFTVVYLAAYERGRKFGYKAGFPTGEAHGRKVGHAAGYHDGKDVGLAEGLAAGRKESASLAVEADKSEREFEALHSAAVKAFSTPLAEGERPWILTKPVTRKVVSKKRAVRKAAKAKGNGARAERGR